MGWLFIVLFAALVLGLLWRFAHVRGSTLELLASALLLGIAGYAWQGMPGLPGQPTPPRAEPGQSDSLFAQERSLFLERFTADAQVLDAADAMHRNGMDAYGIALIRGALAKHPNSPDLWIGMGNALTLYANGFVTPAAELSFQRAARLSPDHPAPAYFLGLAYAQAGQVDRARSIWSDLLARTPANAPWRAAIAQRLAQVQQVQ